MTIDILLDDKSSCWISVSLTVTPTGLVSILLLWTKERRDAEKMKRSAFAHIRGGLKLLSDGLIGAVSWIYDNQGRAEQCCQAEASL